MMILATLLAASLSCRAQPPMAGAPSSSFNPQGHETMSENASNREDIPRLLQLTLDLDILNKYYHPEVAGRTPLCVVKNDAVPAGTNLVKFGQPVRLISAAEKTNGMACFEFYGLQIQGEEARVEFAYEIEGLRGAASFHKSHGIWQAMERRIFER
jgi:hypothetical protein